MEMWASFDDKLLVSSFGNFLKKEKVLVGNVFLDVYKEYLPYFKKSDYTGAGYLAVSIGREGKSRSLTVHRAVATCFLGDMGSDWEVDHIDGDRNNNKLENLRWVSHAENMKNAAKNEAFNFQPKALSEESLIKILEWFESGANLNQISKVSGVDRSTLNRFRSGSTKVKYHKKFILDNFQRFISSSERNKYKFSPPKIAYLK